MSKVRNVSIKDTSLLDLPSFKLSPLLVWGRTNGKEKSQKEMD